MDNITETIINKLDTGVIIIDDNISVVFCNDWIKTISGLDYTEVIGKNLYELWPLLKKAYYTQAFKNAFENRQRMFFSGAFHSTFIMPHDIDVFEQGVEVVKQNMSVEPIDYDGKVYVLLQINDISNQYRQVQMLKQEIQERKRVEDKIRKSEQEMMVLRDQALAASVAKTNFMAMMSHEIRTPMNAIIGMAELLGETDLDKDQLEYVKMFRQASDTLLGIINDILDLAKIEAGKVDKEDILIMLPEFLEDIASMYSYQAQKKGLNFQYNLKCNLPKEAYGDPTRIRQVLGNVLSNAIKFTKTGQVTLFVDCYKVNNDDLELSIKIEDTGIGINNDKMESIFEPFTQADNSTSRNYGGTGLGLTIVKNILEMLGGCIEVQSVEGVGTTFNVKFPLRIREISINYNTSKCDLHSITETIYISEGRIIENRFSSESTISVLIAEDTMDNYRLLELYLKGKDYKLERAHNGLEAVELYQKNIHDLIIMDIEMPELDGLSAARKIRAWELENDICRVPILALTAHALISYQIESVEAGCDYFLTKPVRKKEFLDSITNLLTKKPLPEPY